MEAPALLQGRRILVVEDDYLVAQIVIDYLEEAGATVSGPIGVVDEVIAFIEANEGKFEGVVLDVNLHGKKTYSVADALSEKKIAFVFTTGYGIEALAEDYRVYPRCEKPFNEHVLVSTLAKIIGH
jgi:DNA-binding response OmpR family regulator